MSVIGSSGSNNPWVSSHLEITLTSLQRVAVGSQSFRERKQKLDEPSAPETCVPTAANGEQSSEPKKYSSSLIANLRQLDASIAERREAGEKNVDRRTMVETAALLQDTTALFTDLCDRMRWIQHPSLLRDLLVFEKPFYVWSSISLENRTRVVTSLRSICSVVIDLLRWRCKDSNIPTLYSCLNGIERVATSIGLLEDASETAELPLTAVYELLIECSRALDLLCVFSNDSALSLTIDSSASPSRSRTTSADRSPVKRRQSLVERQASYAAKATADLQDSPNNKIQSQPKPVNRSPVSKSSQNPAKSPLTKSPANKSPLLRSKSSPTRSSPSKALNAFQST